MLKSSKALQFLFLVGLATTVIGIPALLLFVVALKWIFLIYPAVFMGLVMLVSYITAITMLYDDIFGSGRDRRFLEAETIPITDREDFKQLYNTISRSITRLDVIYDNLIGICDSIGVPGIFNTADIDIRMTDMFVRLYDMLGSKAYGLTPLIMFHLWVGNKLLIVQRNEKGDLVYNYDIDVFTEYGNDSNEECYLYIINSDGTFGSFFVGSRQNIIDIYHLTEVN